MGLAVVLCAAVQESPYPLAERTFRLPAPEVLAERLELTDEQRGPLEGLYRELEAQLRSLRRKERGGERARVIEEELRRLGEQFVEKLRGMLSEEQRKKVDRLLRVRAAAEGGVDGEALREALGLDEEQLGKAREIVRGLDQDMRALRELYRGDRLRREIERLVDEVLQDLSAILREDQKPGLDSLRKRILRRRPR